MTAPASRDMRSSRLAAPAAIVASQVLLILACIVGYRASGLSVQWSIPATVPVIIISMVIWILSYPRTRTDAALAFVLLLSGATIVIFAQYPALAFGRPLADETLVHLDRKVGVDVAAIVAWVRQHPRLESAMYYAYETYVPQQIVVIALLAWLRDRRGIWLFLVQEHLCLGIALVFLAFWPASEPYAYLGLDVSHPQTRSVSQIVAYNSGAASVVRVDQPAGLVSFPSCHVAGAIFFVWAYRRVRFVREAATFVNALLLVATVGLGIHYFIDVVAGIVLAIVLVAATERVARSLSAPASFKTAAAES